jgi:hypothetical protein
VEVLLPNQLGVHFVKSKLVPSNSSDHNKLPTPVTEPTGTTAADVKLIMSAPMSAKATVTNINNFLFFIFLPKELLFFDFSLLFDAFLLLILNKDLKFNDLFLVLFGILFALY